jgi:hypothetical protein
MSDNNKTYTIYTRLNYLKGFHASNASNVSKFEAALMRNLLEMSAADRDSLPVTKLTAAVDSIKTAVNELSVVLNDLTRSMRRDNDIPV